MGPCDRPAGYCSWLGALAAVKGLPEVPLKYESLTDRLQELAEQQQTSACRLNAWNFVMNFQTFIGFAPLPPNRHRGGGVPGPPWLRIWRLATFNYFHFHSGTTTITMISNVLSVHALARMISYLPIGYYSTH